MIAVAVLIGSILIFTGLCYIMIEVRKVERQIYGLRTEVRKLFGA